MLGTSKLQRLPAEALPDAAKAEHVEARQLALATKNIHYGRKYLSADLHNTTSRILSPACKVPVSTGWT
ncbi:hypothetical protein NOVOSPHI9U_10443 [Novosphingobium sp. 9U]|nr:hypothetical protein NOVOSPHI9U_10443 [Novosphingobium sp. 9U]